MYGSKCDKCNYWVYFSLSSKTARFYSTCGDDSCSHLPFLVTLCSQDMQMNSIIGAISQTWQKKFHFAHAYITVVFLRCGLHALYQQLRREANHSLVHYCCVWLLLRISARSKGRRSRARWNHEALMRSHSKIPHASHVTGAISHQVTLHWGGHSLRLQKHEAATDEKCTQIPI